jgi:DNA-binding transcriptional regulator YhcF (GntR family)
MAAAGPTELIMIGASVSETPRRRRGTSEYSYKFQRLREKIRQAVAGGELSGKLPGERELARRFQVNAKTLSKALTDLAAEGLLSRSIGRGTFVKGADAEPALTGPWLVVCDADQLQSPLAKALNVFNPAIQTIHDVTSLRPSFLNQFSAVVDLSARTPQNFVRDLLVRNLPLVVVGREPGTFSTNAVLLDTGYLAGRLAYDLMTCGHRRLAAVETDRSAADSPIAKALRAAAGRYAPDATVERCQPAQCVQLIEQGITGLVCDSTTTARAVMAAISEAKIATPGVASITAVGAADADFPCTGFYVGSEQQAEAIVHLLSHGRSGATVLWMTGRHVDRGTTGNAPAAAGATPPILTLTA